MSVQIKTEKRTIVIIVEIEEEWTEGNEDPEDDNLKTYTIKGVNANGAIIEQDLNPITSVYEIFDDPKTSFNIILEAGSY